MRRGSAFIFPAVALLAMAAFFSPVHSACRIDASPVAAFWEVVETLGNDTDPSPELWQKLLDHPGYDVLYATEFEPAFFVEAFSICYRPARRAELARSLHVGHHQHLYRHYRAVLERRAEIDAAIDRLDSENIAERAVERAREFLPDDASAECPQAAIVVFDYGARVHDTIVLDALKLADSDAQEFFAHEFHHWFRSRLLAIDLDALEEPDAMTVRTLNVIQAEGIANFIDKELWVDDPEVIPESQREFADKFIDACHHGNDIVSGIDTLLAEFHHAPPAERAQIGTYLAGALPVGGHAAGFHMARVIERELGRERLIEEAGDPFAFFQSYQEAALRAGGGHAVFGRSSLAVLAMLEEKYRRQDDARR